MTLVLIFALGYMIGGVSVLLLIGLLRAGRNGGRAVQGAIVHDT